MGACHESQPKETYAAPVLPRPGARLFFPDGKGPTFVDASGTKRQVRSLLNVTKPMEYGDFVWNDRNIPPGPTWILVDLKRQTMSLFRGGNEIGTAITLYGVDGTPTPVGPFTVLARAKDHRSSIYDAEMPYTLRLTNDGVSIHGSDVRAGLGTHGCLGIPLAFAAKLFDQVAKGDDVIILRDVAAGALPSPAASTAPRVG